MIDQCQKTRTKKSKKTETTFKKDKVLLKIELIQRKNKEIEKKSFFLRKMQKCIKFLVNLKEFLEFINQIRKRQSKNKKK